MSVALKSTAFSDGGQIPRKHTGEGSDLSPALNWGGVSPAAHTLALIADDPDAPKGTWTHWLVWNIPAHLTGLPEGVPANEVLENGAAQGTNDFHRVGYGGPYPPPGKPHRYFFKLFALNTTLKLPAGACRKDLERAMRGHVLSEAAWMGTYKR